jgi:hypothetical protein
MHLLSKTWPAGVVDRSNPNPKWALSLDALVLVVGLGLFNCFALFLASQHQLLDFSSMYTGGSLVVAGRGALLFDIQTQIEFQHRVLGMKGLLAYNHLAFESLLFAPLALLPFQVALWAWRILSIAMLAYSARTLAGVYRCARWHALWIAVAFFPVVAAIVQGQDSILLLSLLAGTLQLLAADSDRSAGCLLALALFKPQLILPMAAMLVLKRGWRFLLGFLAGSATVLMVSTAITGFGGWRRMFELWRYAASGAGSQIGVNAVSMPNLRGILWLMGLAPHAAFVVALGLSAVLFAAVAWRLRTCRSVERLFPPLVALALLLSPHVNAHDLAILILPIVALLVANKRSLALCAGACFCMPLFLLLGHVALYFFVICAVLFVALREPAHLQLQPAE